MHFLHKEDKIRNTPPKMYGIEVNTQPAVGLSGGWWLTGFQWCSGVPLSSPLLPLIHMPSVFQAIIAEFYLHLYRVHSAMLLLSIQISGMDVDYVCNGELFLLTSTFDFVRINCSCRKEASCKLLKDTFKACGRGGLRTSYSKSLFLSVLCYEDSF